MGSWDHIYQSSRRFTRDLRGTMGGQMRPGSRRLVHEASSAPARAARYVCPRCLEATPADVTCPRCEVLAVDRHTRRRTQIAKGFFAARRLRRRLARKVAELEEQPAVLIAHANGSCRLRGVVVEIREAVGSVADGSAVGLVWDGERLTTDVGSFRIRDQSGSLWIGPAAEAVDVVAPSLASGIEVGVGDVVELVGCIRQADAGPYRSEARLISTVDAPAVLCIRNQE